MRERERERERGRGEPRGLSTRAIDDVSATCGASRTVGKCHSGNLSLCNSFSIWGITLSAATVNAMPALQRGRGKRK